MSESQRLHEEHCTFMSSAPSPWVGVSCAPEFDVYGLSGPLGLLILIKIEIIRRAIYILTHRNCTERAVLDTFSASAECRCRYSKSSS